MNTLAQQAVVEPSLIEKFMDSNIVNYGIKIIGAIAVIMLLLMVSKFIANMVKNKVLKNGTEGNKNIDKIAKLIHDITFYILVIFSFFIGFDVMGFNVGLIVGGISFGVGLAFKEILGNMVAGMMILYTKEFKLGDIIEINADQVYFGKIEEITIRYTIIRTLDLRQVILPNMTLISTPIKTFSSEDIIKLSITFGVHYNSDLPKALKVVTDTINSFDFVKEKPTTKSFVSNFADSYIEIKSFFSFDPKGGLLSDIALGMINERMNESFTQNNIQVPYNTYTLTFDSPKDKTVIQQQLTTPTA